MDDECTMSNPNQTSKRYTLTIGLEEGSVPGGTKGKAIPREVAHSEILRALAQNEIDGASIRGGVGVWKGDTEVSLDLIILGQASQKETIFKMAHDLRLRLRQEAIMIQVETVDLDFI